MADFKGGRGKKTGYQTEMYRIPSPIRPTVEKLGMQFRLLWDGISDPKGEKLISRIESAMPDLEQLKESNGHNQISGKGETPLPDSKYEDEEDTEEEAEQDEPDQSDEQTIRDQAEKNFKLLTENRMLEREIAEVRSQLGDLEGDRDNCLASAEQWAVVAEHNLELADSARGELVEAWAQLDQLKKVEEKAATILKEALKLKANSGGAIKKRIEEALKLIDDI